MLAAAGGTTPVGDDVLIITGQRNGQPFRKVVDIPALFLNDKTCEDILVSGGDTLYVNKAPVYYIYGEAQRPGPYRIERGMTVMQALAQDHTFLAKAQRETADQAAQLDSFRKLRAEFDATGSALTNAKAAQ